MGGQLEEALSSLQREGSSVLVMPHETVPWMVEDAGLRILLEYFQPLCLALSQQACPIIYFA